MIRRSSSFVLFICLLFASCSHQEKHGEMNFQNSVKPYSSHLLKMFSEKKDFNLIERYINSICICQTGYAYLIDYDGNFIVFPRQDLVGQNYRGKADYIEIILKMKTGTINFDSDGEVVDYDENGNKIVIEKIKVKNIATFIDVPNERKILVFKSLLDDCSHINEPSLVTKGQ